jgi:hypothetical protein
MNDTIFDLDDIKYKLKSLSDTDDEAFYMLLTGIIKPTATDYLNKLFLTISFEVGFSTKFITFEVFERV